MKKPIIITVCILLAVISLFPFSVSSLDDGGTTIYTALTWSAVKWNRLSAEQGDVGSIIKAVDFYIFPFNLRDNVSGKVWDEASGKFVAKA